MFIGEVGVCVRVCVHGRGGVGGGGGGGGSYMCVYVYVVGCRCVWVDVCQSVYIWGVRGT